MDNSSHPKKRFIAGAICPRCGVLDRIVNYEREGRSFRECVSCDFKEALHFVPEHAELTTRVNQVDQYAQTETVRIVESADSTSANSTSNNTTTANKQKN